MKPLLRTALYCCPLLFTAGLHAEEQVRYVRDSITIPLRQSQSNDGAIVHPGVTTGTALTIAKDDSGSGFTRVRTGDGVEGWIASRYLIAEPTARMQLEKANAELEELRKTNARLEQEQTNLPADQKLAAQQITQLRNDNAQLQQELQILRESPDNAIQLAQDNIDLKRSNDELLAQVASASTALAEVRGAQNYALFREGALAVIAGAILTVLIPRLKPKKRSEWA